MNIAYTYNMKRYPRIPYKYRKTAGKPSVCCDICQTPMDKLNLDHNHDTGQMRGWLCGQCNKGLGHFQDDIERLRAAITYLSQSKRLATVKILTPLKRGRNVLHLIIALHQR